MSSVYLFVGPPGSGKGSLSMLCTSKLGWTQLSTGNLCRMHIAQQTEIGKKIDEVIKAGKLISDELITQMVDEWFAQSVDSSKPIILDGYPRTIAQAKAFTQILKEKYVDVRLNVVRISVADEVAMTRLCSRYICSNKKCQAIYSLLETSVMKPKTASECDTCGSQLERRKDDFPETVKKRLETYKKHEKDLLNFYENSGQSVIECSGEKPLDAVFSDFKQLIGQKKV